jgi:hypothetical protein
MTVIRTLLDRFTDFADSDDPVTTEELDSFESEIGLALPADYREFLLTRNGGRLPYHNSCRGAPVNVLFGLNAGTTSCDLRWNREAFRGRIPDDFLAVGASDEYPVTCLCLDGKRFGWVFSWDRSEEMDHPLDKISRRLCTSFTKFLRRLRPARSTLQELHAEARGAPEPFRSIILFDLRGLHRALERGCDVNRPLRCEGEGGEPFRWMQSQTALMPAVCQWPEAARILMERGADIHARDDRGRTALNHAASCGSIDGVRILLDGGADPLQADNEGENALRWAYRMGYERILGLIRHRLDLTGVKVDNARIEEDVRRCELVGKLEEMAAREDRERAAVFFWDPPAATAIDDSGFMVACLSHREEEDGNETPTVTLDRVMELLPVTGGVVDTGEPVPSSRHELCDALLNRVARKIVPNRAGVTLGEIADCVRQMYRRVAALSEDCVTREDVFRMVSQTEQEEIEKRLMDGLSEACASTATTRSGWRPPSDPHAASVLRSEYPASVLIEGSGYEVSVGPVAEVSADPPSLDQVLDLSPRIAYPLDSGEPDLDIRDPAVYARYEICKSIFDAVSPRVTVTRSEVTLGEVADCVREVHRRIWDRSRACDTETDVRAKVQSSERRQLERTLLDCLDLACTTGHRPQPNQGHSDEEARNETGQ